MLMKNILWGKIERRGLELYRAGNETNGGKRREKVGGFFCLPSICALNMGPLADLVDGVVVWQANGRQLCGGNLIILHQNAV